jgi:hypothetical protein
MEYKRYIDLENIIISGDLVDRTIIAKEIKLFIDDLLHKLDEHHRKATRRKYCSICNENRFCTVYKHMDEYDAGILYCDDFKFKDKE